MATSDAPLNVPNVTLAVARGGMSGGAGSISWSGTVAHGQTLTINDSQGRFGTRTNVKPVYVSMGDSRQGSSLGRVTADLWREDYINVSVSSAFPVGQIGTSIRVDMSTSGTLGGGGFGPLVWSMPAEARPIIAYTERYYDFLNDAAGTTDETGRDGAGWLNLKTNRVWAAGVNGNNTLPDALSGYQFANGPDGSIAFYVEGQVAQTLENSGTRYYAPSPDYPEGLAYTGRVWVQDEHIVHQSSAVGSNDGHLIHIRNGRQVNRLTDGWITRDSRYPLTFQNCNLDQISNGVGIENVIYYGYQCWDDEYNAVYLGDAATRSACTKLTRQPQTAWTPSQVSIQLVESQVPLSGAYLYFRTGMRSWLSDNGVAL